MESSNIDEEPSTSDSEEEFLDGMYNLANGDMEDIWNKRKECDRCRRPATVCWCPFLPVKKVKIQTNIYILQHPFEELRKLKTAPMLQHSLEEGKCHIIRGKRFSKRNIKYPDLSDILESPHTVLLFPGEDAVDIADLPSQDEPYNLVALDGTWTQAKGMYINNALLKLPRKVMINCDTKSKYVIRTQPTENALSTLESVAVAVSVLENRPALIDILTAPLDALCHFQLQYGAVRHQSKEWKIANGVWTKTLPKKLLREMAREAAKQNGSNVSENCKCDSERHVRNNSTNCNSCNCDLNNTNTESQPYNTVVNDSKGEDNGDIKDNIKDICS